MDKKMYGFKPCYKWMTFNTKEIIKNQLKEKCFKPCYKWMTFNTEREGDE